MEDKSRRFLLTPNSSMLYRSPMPKTKLSKRATKRPKFDIHIVLPEATMESIRVRAQIKGIPASTLARMMLVEAVAGGK